MNIEQCNQRGQINTISETRRGLLVSEIVSEILVSSFLKVASLVEEFFLFLATD